MALSRCVRQYVARAHSVMSRRAKLRVTRIKHGLSRHVMVSRLAAMAFLMVMSGLALRADKCAKSAEAAEGDSSAAATSPSILSAVIDADGKVLRSSSRVTVNKSFSKPGFEVGCYEVIFEESVQSGTYVATIENPGTAAESFGRIKVAPRTSNSKAVFVQTADVTGKPANLRFHLLVIGGSVLPPDRPVTGPAIRTVEVKVYAHSDVPFSKSDAERILKEMGNVLAKDSGNDVDTPIKFTLDGDIRPLPGDIPAVIRSQPQLDRLFNIGPGIKVVRGIQFCDGTTVVSGTIIGCGRRPSVTVNEIVVRLNPANEQEGILWAHEYGHNCGLVHRDNDRAIMNKSVTSIRREVNGQESLAYRGGPLAATAEPHAMAAVEPAEEASAQRPANVLDFVRQHYFEGVPPDIARQYTARDADKLLPLLKNPGEDLEFLPEIVATICYIGPEKAVQPLIDFVNGPMSGETALRAKNAALIHLGDLVNKTKNKKALDFLKNMASKPETAQNLAENVASAMVAAADDNATGPSEEDLASEFAASALWGLAMSGTEESEAALLEIVTQDENVLPAVQEIAPEALKINRDIQPVGSVEYRIEQQCKDCE